MEMKMPVEEAKALAKKLMREGYHCGPSILQVMWEAYGLENEDFLWAGIPFLGGIGGFQNAPCGIVSSTAVCIGLRYRSPLDDNERAKQARHAIRNFSARLVSEFNQEFGNITCLGLIGMDFSKPDVYKEFHKSGIWKEKCEKYMEFMIDKLYALEENKGLFVMA